MWFTDKNQQHGRTGTRGKKTKGYMDMNMNRDMDTDTDKGMRIYRYADGCRKFYNLILFFSSFFLTSLAWHGLRGLD